MLDRLENTRLANDIPDCDHSACRTILCGRVITLIPIPAAQRW